jgi:hypothetical protein
MGSESFDVDLSGIMDARNFWMHGIFADASRRTEKAAAAAYPFD